MNIEISASILSANFLRLEDEIQSSVEAGVNSLHFDIMDGHFVPNLTFGPMILRSVRTAADIPFAAHLMVEHPEAFLDECLTSGATTIFVHPESCCHLHRTLSYIKEKGGSPGVAVNPSTALNFLPYVIDVVDEILIMTVNPGFAAQKMILRALPKIKEARETGTRLGKSLKIGVDGGINLETLLLVVQEGATNIITASAFYGAKERKAFIAGMREIALNF